ncbi:MULTISPECIES: HlyD family secretion protein [unclassified Curtobacterium]|uniref:HlyD family efflux transporter periplasmic adaptor subunit n=1 Tax=unclassified Curtobacterium TaxID=257496 RepID=UPI000D9E8C41|nr:MULTISPECIES: HlyD family secretion protein [unclassified Curtobacterium]PYY41503.1 biotin attachment protein [Curtobacterium sp. MCPF17_046]PZE94660.1 biotin attachment protein [Curtobacterium sp. MCBD17_008]WIB15369.1 HlyD family efflux transporter periplasmic adaptor subunit [Curtobacterium sp. MCPF17_050]
MTWTNRLRLYGGILVVLVVVAACTLVFNQRRSAVTSASAAITAQEYAVGTDYGGTVTEEYVEEGDTVREGQELMQVQSLQLAQDIRKGVVGADTTTSAYEIEPDGLITFKAEVSGTVAKLDVKAGGYVQAGSELGTIHKAKSLFVTSEFLVSPRDYGRITDGATVDLRLPNDRSIEGTVKNVSVVTDADGQAKTTVSVESPELSASPSSGVTSPGTPVDATLHLRDDGRLAGVTDAFRDFLRQIGI